MHPSKTPQIRPKRLQLDRWFGKIQFSCPFVGIYHALQWLFSKHLKGWACFQSELTLLREVFFRNKSWKEVSQENCLPVIFYRMGLVRTFFVYVINIVFCEFVYSWGCVGTRGIIRSVWRWRHGHDTSWGYHQMSHNRWVMMSGLWEGIVIWD